MNTLQKTDCLAAGLAIFAMFFGAGNIIFPLALGQMTLDKTPWGLAGLLLTAVVIPFMGLLAMFRYQGKIRLFFSRLGPLTGFILASVIIFLLGPLGAAPRCLALAHSTLSLSLPGIPLLLFSALACVIIFLFTYKESQLLKLLGYVLSPLKIALLIAIIIKGFIEAPAATLLSTDLSSLSYFWKGLTQGYNTMDLLAAFFFAPLVLSSMRYMNKEENKNRFALIASTIGASLLAIVYIGFCYLAYLYAPYLEATTHEQLLGAIAILILGKHAGLIVSLTVTFACLTTAIALIAAFARFMEKEVLREKLGYLPILILSLLLTFGVTTLEFQGIARFLNPILEICYPALIGLTLYNLFTKVPEEELLKLPLTKKA